MSRSNSNKKTIGEYITEQLEVFFKKYTSITQENIERLLAYYTPIVMATTIGLKGLHGIQDDVNPELRKEGSKIILEQNTRLMILLLKLFNEYNLKPKPSFNLPENMNFEEEFDDFIFDILKEVEPLTRELKLLYGLDGDENTENFGLIYNILHKNQRITNKEFEAVKNILDFYNEYYELFVNGILRPAYLQISRNEELRTLSEKDTAGKIVNFFKKCKKGKFSELLEGFDPFVRNAYTHKQRNRWTFKMSKQSYVFRDENLENDKLISIQDFLFNYLGSIEMVWNLADKQLPLIQNIMKREKEFIEYVKDSEKLIPHYPLKFIHPILRGFVFYSDLLRKEKEKIGLFEEVERITKEVVMELLKLITLEEESQWIPLYLRYIISDYPYKKPRIFKCKLCEEYLRLVPIASLGEDRNFLESLKIRFCE